MEENKKTFIKRYFSKVVEKISPAYKSFGITEKALFFACFAVMFVSVFSIVDKINKYFLVQIPTSGGILEEGIVGIPRFINPLLAISDADRDMTSLIYSGLFRFDENGKLIPDLASEYTVSENGKEYSVKLKDNIYFHDNKPITADDVVFTIEKAVDNMLKSPKRPYWEDVSVEKISDKEIKFSLRNPYAPFPTNFTMGILPKHIWESIDSEEFPSSQFNMEPVGSGPYKVKTIKRNSGGLLVYYELEPFSKFTLGRANISTLILRFYKNEKSMIEAFNQGYISAISSISPKDAEQLNSSDSTILKIPMPRVYAVFFNQNQNKVFSYKEVRNALNVAVDREKIISDILKGYGESLFGPIPKGLNEKLGNINETFLATSTEARIIEAKRILTKAGWKEDGEGTMELKTKKETQKLAFTIYTNDISSDFVNIANMLKESWQKIGAKVEIITYKTNDLSNTIIRPRKFDALLFGEIVGRDLDLFAFWHSSQRNDPGYNISMYANSVVDKLLDEARKTQDVTQRIEKYEKFEQEIVKDVPAIFIYSPDFIYVVPKEIKGINISNIITPGERFSQIYKWFIETDKVWSVFEKN